MEPRSRGSPPIRRSPGFRFGEAVFWREALDQENLKGLRVNLAHFGWNKTVRYGRDKNWAKDICQMMADYSHLYTDVSHHSVLSYRTRRLFKEDYVGMRRDWDADWSEIKKKILFGIDWHTIKRVKGFRDFQQRYIEVLSHDGLFSRSEIEDFLGGNALRFLGLLPNGQNRKRLETFYQNHNISPPDWFTSTAGQRESGG